MPARRGLRKLGTILGIVVAAALVWMAFTIALLWHRQERVVFQPPAVVPGAPASARRVEFRASDGHGLYGYLLEPGAGSREPGTVVIAFHGNADLSAWLVPWASELARRTGAVVFLPEYRGYGGIAGSSTYASSAQDARGAIAWARAEYPGARVVLFGHSLGSAIAAELARSMAPEQPAALVLQSPFTSAQAMAARMLVPPVPALWALISRVHYDTRRIVSELDAPVWVSHGTRDVVIPVRMGRSVFEAARRKGDLLIVGGAGHNDVADAGAGAYWAWLTAAVSAPTADK
jgi:alpha-beta hydrolase superfamily lysophospholipase